MITLPSRLQRILVFGLFLLAATSVLAPSVSRGACEPPPGGGGDPSPPNATIPCGINLIGMTAGVADSRGEFTVTVRDLASNPVAGCEVEIDFGGCALDIRVATDQPFPGLTMECLAGPHAIVRALTDGAGQATFRIVGGAQSIPEMGSDYQCGEIRAGGTLLGRVTVAAFDLDRSGGVNPADLSVYFRDVYSQPFYKGRLDYNCSHSLTPVDLSLMLRAGFSGGSTQSATSYCN